VPTKDTRRMKGNRGVSNGTHPAEAHKGAAEVIFVRKWTGRGPIKCFIESEKGGDQFGGREKSILNRSRVLGFSPGTGRLKKKG